MQRVSLTNAEHINTPIHDDETKLSADPSEKKVKTKQKQQEKRNECLFLIIICAVCCVHAYQDLMITNEVCLHQELYRS